jgi:hypothetical protein
MDGNRLRTRPSAPSSRENSVTGPLSSYVIQIKRSLILVTSVRTLFIEFFIWAFLQYLDQEFTLGMYGYNFEIMARQGQE